MTTNSSRSWARAQLAEIARVVRGRVTPQEHPDLPFIGMDAVEAHTMRLLGTAQASTMKSAAVHFRPGDVLYGRLRPYLNKVVAPDFEGLASAEFIPLTPPDGVEPRFLRYRINASDFVSYASGLDEGDRPRVDYDQIGAFRVDVPPTSEQHRIVNAIESHFTRLDDAVVTLERLQRNLKRYRASVLHAAVEGRLVPTEAELARAEGRSYEHASVLLQRILAERRLYWEEAELAKMKGKGRVPKDDTWKTNYEAPQPPDAADLPSLPEGWCWSSIGELFDVRVGATPSRSKPEYWGGGIPWVSSGEVSFCRIGRTRETISEAGLRNSSTQLNPTGSVLLGMIGEGRTRGQAAILTVPACNNQNSAAILVGAAGLPPEYVYYFLMGQYEVTRTRGSGNNQPALNKSRVQAIPIPLPLLAEARRIVAEIEEHNSVIDSLDESGRLSRVRCARLRQSILKWAFEGRLVDQDPSDEPASVLLERIRAEREAAAADGPQRRPRVLRRRRNSGAPDAARPQP